MTTPGGLGHGAPRGKDRRGVTAILLQLGVLALTAGMGVMWGGPTYVAAIVAGAVGVGVVVWLARRRPPAALVVPVVSVLLTFGLLWVGDLLARNSECSPAERAAFAELAAPPTSRGAMIELRGEMANGCIARFDTSLSGAEVAAHYEREFTAHGWQAGPDAAATKNGIVVRIETFESVRRAGTLVIVTVGEE